MLKNGMVSDGSNTQAAERLGDMVEYMKSDEYRKRREPKAAKEEAAPVYIKGPETIGAQEQEEQLNDEDHELMMLRQRRLEQMKAKQQKAAELRKAGHGIYREVDEKEFLPEVTSTQFTAVHFYHQNFKRCEVMHNKIGEVSARLVQVKFLKINAEEAPFFTDKLAITVLPCVILFKDGVAVDRIQGFEGLSYSDSFPTSRLEKVICKTFKLEMTSQGLDEDAQDEF